MVTGDGDPKVTVRQLVAAPSGHELWGEPRHGVETMAAEV